MIRAGTTDRGRPWLLAIDTATSRVVVAAGSADGNLLGAAAWPAGHRHGELLLPSIDRLGGELELRLAGIDGIIVGTGPGAFTGLRVGIATAKALAHGLGRPIAGVSTAAALIAAAGRAAGNDARGPIVLLLPAGPSDRVVVREAGRPLLLPGGSEPGLACGDLLVAVDLDARAPAEAVGRGEQAHDGLAAELLRLGAARLAGAEPDDLARLVPEYVTLPRGVLAATGEVTWSRDPR